MASDSNGNDNKANAQENGVSLGENAPVKIKEKVDTAIDGEENENQAAITNKALVDRINRSDRWMIGLTAVIAFVGIISAVIFGMQLTAMQGQVDEMKAEQRPWIYADLSVSGAIFHNQSGGLTFPIGFTLHNTGHLPATYVSPDIEAYLSGTDGKTGSSMARERQKRHCDSLVQQPSASDQIGTTVFPGQSVPFGRAVGIDLKEIESTKKLGRDRTGQEMDYLAPWVVGCIRYRSPDGGFHQTGVAFTIAMTKPGQSMPFALPLDPTGIDRAQIAIMPWVEGGVAYAY